MEKFVETLFEKCALAAPDRILVATDLTDLEYLTPHIIAQAIACPAHVTLVHAVIVTDSLPVEAAAVPYIDMSRINRDARLMLMGAAREITAHGICCDAVVRNGYATDIIREEIKRTGATRLIMGTHGRGKLGQLVLGSVAQELITRVNIPVFVVGPLARHSLRHVTPRRILHPVSLMGDYQESVDLAVEIAQACRAELTLLHVLDRDIADAINPERVLDWAGNALAALVPDPTDLVPRVYTMVTTGKLADEILNAADQTDADLIVLGADGGHRFGPLSASAAYQVLAAAKCPVLTLRHEPHPHQMDARKREEVHFTFPV
ncbi:universal stress protein [Paracidobacterium acidisoli]|uniref:Universal stress protein n=1 Tax=Paracidobacterium acidisoli TaxID=2303751 RepID=A0A372IIQ4_9BACT|nr:universal stress protein [Paracidobacterium acidisoli]MBT9333384.1 universal stress protein [Paracidobacterium acidisoli]